MGRIIVLGAGASKGASFSPTPPVMPGFFREAQQWYRENRQRDLYEELWFHYACQNCFIAGGTTPCKDRINLEDLFLRIDQRCQKVQKRVSNKKSPHLLEIVRSALSKELFALESLHQVPPNDFPDPSSSMKEVAGLDLHRLELLVWRIIRLHLLFLLATFLAHRTANQTCQYHKSLVSHLAPGDVVISFNYDTIMDHALHSLGSWNYSEGYGVSFNPEVSSHVSHKRYGCCEMPGMKMEDRILLLKPHGSLNWVAVLEPSLDPSVSANVLDRPLGRPIGYHNAEIANYFWEKALPVGEPKTAWEIPIEAPAIIPPVKDKETFIGDLNERRPHLIPGQEQTGEHLYVHPYQPVRGLCERAVHSGKSDLIYRLFTPTD